MKPQRGAKWNICAPKQARSALLRSTANILCLIPPRIWLVSRKLCQCILIVLSHLKSMHMSLCVQ